MHFLYPGFLFALIALAIPFVVHLFNFRRYQKVYFSNVQFLKTLEERQSSRQNIKDRLILLTRLLALTFLIFAFAKPFIAANNLAANGKQQWVSVFIDNSYSMQTLSKEGLLLDQAKRDAKEIALTYGINDRFQLLTQDFDGAQQRFLSRDEFSKAVDEVKTSAESRDLGQIIDRQQNLLKDNQGNKTIFILSDFQNNIRGPIASIDGTVKVNLLQLKANPLPNLAVDSVSLINATHHPGESERLVVKLHNYADKAAENVPLKLTINGVQKALASFNLAARGVQYDTLTFSGLTAGWQKAKLTLQDNPVVFDNQFYFAFNVPARMPVLIINGGLPNAYLQAAFATDNFFKITQVNSGNVNFSELIQYDAVFVADVAEIPVGLAQQLTTYVQKGGSLTVFPPADGDLKSYQAFLSSLKAAYPQQLVTEKTKVSAINVHSKIFNTVFEKLPDQPDLPAVNKYYRLAGGNGPAENIMSMANGLPFVVSYLFGKGKVYELAVPLNEGYSTLPRHGLLLPLVFRISLISEHDSPLYYTIGQNEAVETIDLTLSEKNIPKLVNGNQAIIPDVRELEGSATLYLSDQVKQPGCYDLKAGETTAAVIAFNNNREESDLSYLTAAKIKQLLPAANIINNGEGTVKSQLTASSQGMQLWKVCLILALISLAAEIFIIRYYKIHARSNIISG